MNRDLVVALSGGIGGAKLALGLSRILPADNLLVVANVGDDFEHLGLHISPDVDTLMYTLAGLDNKKLGWGRRDETWSFMETLTALGGEDWFRMAIATWRFMSSAQFGCGEVKLYPPSPPTSAAGSASVRECCPRQMIAYAPDCELMRGGSIFRITSCVFNAALSCGSLPSKGRRMRALILTFWRPCATNGSAQ